MAWLAAVGLGAWVGGKPCKKPRQLLLLLLVLPGASKAAAQQRQHLTDATHTPLPHIQHQRSRRAPPSLRSWSRPLPTRPPRPPRRPQRAASPRRPSRWVNGLLGGARTLTPKTHTPTLHRLSLSIYIYPPSTTTNTKLQHPFNAHRCLVPLRIYIYIYIPTPHKPRTPWPCRSPPRRCSSRGSWSSAPPSSPG